MLKELINEKINTLIVLYKVQSRTFILHCYNNKLIFNKVNKIPASRVI